MSSLTAFLGPTTLPPARPILSPMPTPPSPLACPACHEPFPDGNINVGANVAFCRTCSKAHVLSTLAGAPPAPVIVASDPERQRLARLVASVDPAKPPAGAWFRDDGLQTVVGASTRSLGGALAALGICLFWNGIVSVFVLVAIAGSLHHMGTAIPHWFPAPQMSGGGMMSLGMVLFLWVFLTPFILVGLVIFATFVTMLGGRVEVTLRDNQGRVFTGIGSLGWTRRFDAAQVKNVDLAERRWRNEDGDPRQSQEILIDAEKAVRLGSTLREERKVFLAGVLKRILTG